MLVSCSIRFASFERATARFSRKTIDLRKHIARDDLEKTIAYYEPRIAIMLIKSGLVYVNVRIIEANINNNNIFGEEMQFDDVNNII